MGCAAVGLVASKVEAQTSGGIKRTIIHKTEFPGDTYATLLVNVEIAPGFKVERHTHPGVESAYVLDGGGRLTVKGQPDREVKAGDGFQVPPETPHAFDGGGAPTRLAITYVVDKNKPLASPAPE